VGCGSGPRAEIDRGRAGSGAPSAEAPVGRTDFFAPRRGTKRAAMAVVPFFSPAPAGAEGKNRARGGRCVHLFFFWLTSANLGPG